MGESLGRDWTSSRKNAWKDVNRKLKGGSKSEKVVKDGNGRMLRRKKGSGKMWGEYFE